MKVKTKRYMTLLELLIAAGLTALLLTTVAYFYRQVTLLNQQSELEQKKSFQRRYAEARLMKVIPSIEREYNIKSKHYFAFFTDNDLGLFLPGSPSLVFIYYTSTDLKPEQAVRMVGRLFLNKQHQLQLASWPSPDIWGTTTPPLAKLETLLDNVDSLQFKFYNPPKRQRDKIDKNFKEQPPTADLESQEQWVSEWKQEYQRIPPMIKIIIKQPENSPISGQDTQLETTFAFPLPNSSKVIIYEQ